MPLYEFVCAGCRKKIEELCSSPPDVVTCPQCGGEAKKIFSKFRSGKSGSGGGGSFSGGCGG